MASLCGTSNALNQLQKHTSVDRTLQQDRIQTLRSSQSQSFRSSPSIAGPSQAESEFEQFSGIPQGPRLLHPHSQQLHGPVFSQQQQQQLQPVGLPVWAAEFQNLSLNAPQQHTPFRQSTPQPWAMNSVAVDWGTEFLKQTSKPASSSLTSQNPTLRESQSHSQLYTPQFTSPNYYALHNGPQSIYQPSISQPTQEQTQQQKQASDAAFELAFQEATSWQQLETTQHDELDAIITSTVYEEETLTEETKKEQEEQPRDVEQDADELAKTAGQLLESLSGNQNRKFENSTFLALMRNLRDKKVKVEGDKMVEVEAH